MNVNDVTELEIQSNGMNGEGIARLDGKVVFVPYTLKGERVRAVIKLIKKKYAAASVIKVLSSSEFRRTPECPHFYKCGGCDTGHITDGYRREVLLAELENNLKKIAEINFAPTEFVASASGKGQRNKLSMPFGYSGEKVVLGLYRQNTHVVEAVECMFASDGLRKVARIVRDFADEKRLSVYSEKTGNGLLRHLVLREAQGRISATLVINAQGFSGEDELAARLGDNVDFFVCPNTRRNNVILGDAVRKISGNDRLEVNVLGVKAELSPLSFFQVNDEIRDRLYTDAIAEIESKTLLDLYSGIGITSNLAARKCDRVIAVECVPQAVRDADGTAALNGNSAKIKNICGDVERVIGEVCERAGETDVLVDPPRKGCAAEVMRSIAAVKPNKLIYISCNHATMCRDLRVFLDASPEYAMTLCKAYDMFPDTHHIETLAIMTKIDPTCVKT